MNKHIEEMENSDAQLNAIQMNLSTSKLKSVAIGINPINRFNKDRRGQFLCNNNNNLKFCHFCHLSQQPKTVVISHEIEDLSCPSLSERDKTAIKEKTGCLAPLVSEEDDLTLLARLVMVMGRTSTIRRFILALYPPNYHLFKIIKLYILT